MKRHFRELGTDVERTDFSVIRIGDMSGDVFGNGMLLSRHTRLLGAFDHRHVFLDPDPDPEASFAERERLFRLPGSSWADYDGPHLAGGRRLPAHGQDDRARARGACCARRRGRFADAERNEVHALLLPPVDLLWNGGIGTYVKARAERLRRGRRQESNDAVRVDAEACAAAWSERAATSASRSAPGSPTRSAAAASMDAIDNSAGVDCSDHEVNIKILLDSIVAEGGLTGKQRNALLAEMADEVAALVLRDNCEQAQALSTSAAQAASMVEVHQRYIRSLEQEGVLSRELEVLLATRHSTSAKRRARA